MDDLEKQTGVTVRKCSIWVKIDHFFFSRVTLKFDGWPYKTIGHLFWPWPFAWTSRLSMVITLEIFRIRWQKHCQKGVIDGQTDRWKEVFLELLGHSWKKTSIDYMLTWMFYTTDILHAHVAFDWVELIDTRRTNAGFLSCIDFQNGKITPNSFTCKIAHDQSTKWEPSNDEDVCL